ncbi:GNAT family N-acetyltransferase [Paenibacillus sp.]|jgi:GNAT superfamily N-acetyltransferase|uniref:GNAT family N-acetyltransferase n=1 Tax=Paenibacillus sp. TaxID=58172 RepID=UPI002835D782|nr:GNAT family N-acetyltransferase [Paenibacillus sp.]MDR0267215.1 GNAT family N-acetyltransferase [Paenibacillus sp.]
MSQPNIREIRVTDYHDIYLLNLDFNPNLHTFSEEKVRGKIEIITSKTKDIIYVYEQNNKVIGYIHGSPYELLTSDPLVNVLGFVVKEEHRNHGIGSMLMESLVQWAEDNGYSGIKLLSHPSRINAHRFYERRGFIFTKDQKNFIKKFN